MTDLKNIKTFEELLDLKYGKIGSPKRDQFHEDAKKYIIGEMIREARRQAKLTQAELAIVSKIPEAIYEQSNWK